MKKKILISLITVAICNIVFCISTYAWSTQYTISNFVGYQQQETNWCWAACAETSGKHENPSTNKSQAMAVYYVKGSFVNEGGDMYDVAKAAEYISNGVEYSPYLGTIVTEGLISSILRDHITILGIFSYDGNYYHTLAVKGIWYSDTNPYIYTYDPWDGMYNLSSYRSYFDGSGDDWRETCSVKG